MDSVTPTTFIKKPMGVTLREECLMYTKEILHGRLFLGCYKERRYVQELGQYRDVILVSNDEIELQKDLEKVKKKWENVHNLKWVGITGPDKLDIYNTYYFWVNLNNLPFNNYWFQIKHVRLIENEVLIQLKCIRKCSTLHLPNLHNHSSRNEMQISTPNIQSYLTMKNFMSVARFILVLLATMTFGAISGVKSISGYLLILIRELSNLIQALTPIIVQLIDFCTKVIGGLFIIIAGLLNINRRSPFLDKSTNMVAYARAENYPHLTKNWKERNRLLREELFFVKKS